jgi:signal peptidase II
MAESIRYYRWFGGLLILLVVAADQWSKEYMLYDLNLIRGQSYEVTPFFNLVMVWNQGVSFGMFSGESEVTRWVLVVLTGALAIGLSIWLWRCHDRLLVTALGLIVGGAIGNIMDRLRYGAVADFLDVHVAGWHWPAFNVADACICMGVALLLLESIIRKKPDA